MADIVQFDVDDNSPLLSYFPFAASLPAPSFSSGWNILFNQSSLAGVPLETGNSTSVHVTSLNGAAIQIQWRGVGIRLVGTNTTQATVSVELDGNASESNSTDPDTLYAVDNLPNTNHIVKLTTVTTNVSGNAARDFIVFQKAVIRAGIPSTGNNLSTNFTEQPLNDNLINFRGNWEINSTTSFRQSLSVNDTALAMFLGTACIIRGVVSPNGAKFAVSLDNSTVSGLSSKASFTRNDSVLFYASGLDPDTSHSLEILNEDGGELMLPLGSFSSFASGSPDPSPSPSPSSIPVNDTSSSSSLSSGTIAALALAGILAFIVITVSLFYFLVYRPRTRKRQQLRRQRIQQAVQRPLDDPVLDIGRTGASSSSRSPGKSPIKTLRSKKSTGSGFRAWKEQARGGNSKELKKLGLLFRHSDSAKSKPGPSSLVDEEWDGNEPTSAKSFDFTVPSTIESSQSPSRGLGTGKGKGKKPSLWSLRSKKSSKSSSPSYNVDLPPLHKESGSDNTNGRARYSYFSEFTDITYMSTPTDPSRQLSFNTLSNPSNGASKRPTPSPNTHERVDSHGLLLLNQDNSENPIPDAQSMVSGAEPAPTIPSSYRTNEPEVYVQEVSSAYTDSLNLHRSVPPSAPGLGIVTGRAPNEYPVPRDADRGSVRTYDADDVLSLLGPATARAAIRGLSPRISEVPSRGSSADMESRHLEAVPPTYTHHSLASTGESHHQRERVISDETVRPDASGRFLNVRASSPFRLDFLGGRQRDSQDRKKAARLSEGSRVRFDEHTAPPSINSDHDKGKGRAVESSQLINVPSNQAFRLTPQMPFTLPRSEAEFSIQTSFLDFSGSSGNSVMSGSNETSESYRRLSAFSGLPAPQSRWSSTTAPSSTAPRQHSSSSGSHRSQPSHAETSPEQSPPSYHFPFPVSLPASPHHPEGFKPSPPTSPSTYEDQLPEPHLHPTSLPNNPVSPAGSVPMSISELHFRHSDSDSHGDLDTQLPSHSSLLPPHPPLPASVPPTPTRPQTDAAPAPNPEVIITTPTTRIIFGPRSPTRRDSSNLTTPTQSRMGPRQPTR